MRTAPTPFIECVYNHFRFKIWRQCCDDTMLETEYLITKNDEYYATCSQLHIALEIVRGVEELNAKGNF